MHASAQSSQPLKVVVAEDDENTRLGLVQVLERTLGHRVVGQASTGLELVTIVLTARPDLVVLDLHLPQLNGIDALRKIHAEFAVAAIVITGDTDPDVLRRTCQEPIQGFFIKPIDFTQLEPALQVAHARFQQIRQLETENARLEKSLESRKLVERAKGVLMRRHRWTEAEAFRRLQRAAMNRRTTMADLARQLLDGKEIDL